MQNRIVCLLLIAASFRAPAGAAEDELRAAHAEAEAALQNFVSRLKHDFDAQLVSVEIRKWLQEETAARFGLPVPIEKMTLACRGAHLTVRAELGDVPEAFKARAQARVDELLKESQYGVEAAGPALLRSAVGQFLDRRDFDIIRMEPEILDLELAGLHEKFLFGRNVQVVRLRVDRTGKLPALIRLYMENKEFFSVAVTYGPQAVPGRGELSMPSRTVTEHNLKGTSLPQRYTVDYVGYRFAAPERPAPSP